MVSSRAIVRFAITMMPMPTDSDSGTTDVDLTGAPSACVSNELGELKATAKAKMLVLSNEQREKMGMGTENEQKA